MSKENSGQSTEYYIVNGTYVGEVTEIGNQRFVITYLYGTDGIAGIDVNGSAYYFVKNLQGDVTGILDSNGNTVGTYEYEAYGVITAIKNAQGYNIMYSSGYDTSVLQLNPFRYRGYMFDPESEFYYLNSRYYDPWTSRFLNADAMVSTGQGFDGNNMFAYCLNNPVMYKDPAGNRSVEAIEADIKYVEGRIEYVRSVIANAGPNPYHYNAKTICGLKYWLKDLQAELEAEKARKAHPLGGSDIGITYDKHGNARDFAAAAGVPIFAAMGGTVTEVVMNFENDFYSGSTKQMNEYGNYIKITVWDGTEIIYAHQHQSNYVQVGDVVSAGQQIGQVGHTGFCIPKGYNHLHFQSSGDNVLNYFYHN